LLFATKELTRNAANKEAATMIAIIAIYFLPSFGIDCH
jgi:hypothetical protein